MRRREAIFEAVMFIALVIVVLATTALAIYTVISLITGHPLAHSVTDTITICSGPGKGC